MINLERANLFIALARLYVTIVWKLNRSLRTNDQVSMLESFRLFTETYGDLILGSGNIEFETGSIEMRKLEL